MNHSLKTSLIRILRAFVFLFSISFASLFSCVIIYGVFSLSIFLFAFCVCLGLCTVSCFLSSRNVICVVLLTCSALFFAAALVLVFQIGCSSGEQAMCMMLIWRVDNTSGAGKSLEEKTKSAKVLLLCASIAILVVAGTLDALALQLKSISAEVVASPPTDHNYQCTIPAVRMSEVRNRFRSEDCSICQEAFEDQHSVVLLSCGHVYHYTCINAWVSRAQVCPMCRESINQVELIPTAVDKSETAVVQV